jgi:ribosomal protein L11 methyltransferase
VLDFGTGTGVLSIAAAQLGAKSVMAADLNPLCVKTALHNVELNNLGHIIQVRESKAEDLVHEPADLVMANIHHAVIKSLVEFRQFKPGERLILSGLMRSQSREVKDRLRSKDFKIIKIWDHEMIWFTMLGMKNDK